MREHTLARLAPKRLGHIYRLRGRIGYIYPPTGPGRGGVRVRLRVKSPRTGREVITSALVSSGYEAETPQLLVPRRLALELGLWPPPEDAQLLEFWTAGGPTRVYLVPQSLEVSVDAGDRIVGPVKCDAVVSTTEYEVLISDILGSNLGIVILDLRGKWRFTDEDTVRVTEPPQYWF